MLENKRQYENARYQCKRLTEILKEYKGKLKIDKDNLGLKTQYDIFRGQLSELKAEISDYKETQEFIKHANEGDYDWVGLRSFFNPELKNNLSKEQLIELSNYYEEQFRKLFLEKTDMKNKLEKGVKKR